MLLSELLSLVYGKSWHYDCEVSGIDTDSRKVGAGWIFIAIKGLHIDANVFAADCVTRGACLIVSEVVPENVDRSSVLIVKDVRLAATMLISAYYGGVGDICYAAVTGTDGKSSSVHYYYQILSGLGARVAQIGTLGARWNLSRELSADVPAGVTTYEPTDLYCLIKEFRAYGIGDVCLEASSQGLDQCRLDAVTFDVAAFTNLAADHIEYHGNEENYFLAKKRLFTELLTGIAVVNIDDKYFNDIVSSVPDIISYGMRDSADICLLRHDITGQFKLRVLGEMYNCKVRTLGLFAVYNVMCAIGMVIARGGMKITEIMKILPDLESPDGRMEIAGYTRNECPVIIDYAHTANALENVLRTLRALGTGRVIVVFGCGGDRDVAKRPEMGAIAARYADIVVVTDDNPRFENAENIRKEIMLGCPGAYNVGDRVEAVGLAMSLSLPGDIVLLAGKGHETSQIIGDKVMSYSDKNAVLNFLNKNP